MKEMIEINAETNAKIVIRAWNIQAELYEIIEVMKIGGMNNNDIYFKLQLVTDRLVEKVLKDKNILLPDLEENLENLEN
jgi:hypothetical protein